LTYLTAESGIGQPQAAEEELQVRDKAASFTVDS
jgi:hypothetical protein